MALPSIAQLSVRYGRDTAQSIQGGMGTVIAYFGSDPETASFFERIIGKTRVFQYQDPTYQGAQSHIEQALFLAKEIRTMRSEDVLIVSGNQDPVLILSRGYYEVGRMRRATSLPPVPVDVNVGRRLGEMGL